MTPTIFVCYPIISYIWKGRCEWLLICTDIFNCKQITKAESYLKPIHGNYKSLMHIMIRSFLLVSLHYICICRIRINYFLKYIVCGVFSISNHFAKCLAFLIKFTWIRQIFICNIIWFSHSLRSYVPSVIRSRF